MTIQKIKQYATILDTKQQLRIKGGTSDTNGNASIIDTDEVMQ